MTSFIKKFHSSLGFSGAIPFWEQTGLEEKLQKEYSLM